MAKNENDPAPVVVRKYANRRLYDTASSRYVTLDDLCAMVKAGVDFVVHDAKSGEDITRSVFAQIILEREAKGENLLPIGFLRQLIGCYDDNLRALVPSYLEAAMNGFADNQDRMRRDMEAAFGEFFPARAMRDASEKNMAMFRQAAAMFDPFAAARPGGARAAPDPAPEPEAREIDELRAQLAKMQARIDALDKSG